MDGMRGNSSIVNQLSDSSVRVSALIFDWIGREQYFLGFFERPMRGLFAEVEER